MINWVRKALAENARFGAFFFEVEKSAGNAALFLALAVNHRSLLHDVPVRLVFRSGIDLRANHFDPQRRI